MPCRGCCILAARNVCSDHFFNILRGYIPYCCSQIPAIPADATDEIKSTQTKTLEMKLNNKSSMAVAISFAFQANALFAAPCSQVTSAPDCNTDNPIACSTTQQGIGPCPGSTRCLDAAPTWKKVFVFAQSKCHSNQDPNSKCTEESAYCQMFESGTCASAVTGKCSAKFTAGIGWQIVEAGVEGAVEFDIYACQETRTVGPVPQGSGTLATAR